MDNFSPTKRTQDAAFRSATTGLVSAAEFKRRRDELERDAEAAAAEAAKARARARKRKAKARRRESQRLSFADDSGDERGSPPAAKRAAKDPAAVTHFLPDRAREEAEARERELLAAEFEARQRAAKAEQIEVTYSYWDGSGHRRRALVSKGTTVGEFLARCLDTLSGGFAELRSASADALMYVKEDCIVPHHLSFHDLIASRARGRRGPLFRFDAEVRVQSSSAAPEVDESHAGKVVTRAWYDRNKHIFPAARWELFDPKKHVAAPFYCWRPFMRCASAGGARSSGVSPDGFSALTLAPRAASSSTMSRRLNMAARCMSELPVRSQ